MQYKKGLQRLSETVCKTNSTISDVPIVELVGNHRVLIENHKGVIEYSGDVICVKVKFGLLCVQGQQLEFAKMTKVQLVITGKIQSLVLRGKGEV